MPRTIHTPVTRLTYSAHIRYGTNLYLKNNNGNAPMHVATIKGDVEALQRLLAAGTDPNHKNSYGYTPLQWASSNCIRPKVLAQLLAAGADPYSKINDSDTPLHYIAVYGDAKLSKLKLKLLRAANADPNHKDQYGDTPLHSAAAYGNTEVWSRYWPSAPT